MTSFRPRPGKASPTVPPLLGLMLVAQLLAVPALAADDHEVLLERMNRAMVELDYAGDFSYFRGGELSSLSIVHAVVDGESRERLVHLDGAPRAIYRRGEAVTCVFQPGDRQLELHDSIPSGPFARSFAEALVRLPGQYRARILGAHRVAGRAATGVEIAAIDDARYGYRLWLDDASGLLLRSELLDVDGTALEIFQFVSLMVAPAIDPALFEPPPDQRLVTHRLRLRDPAAARPVTSDWEAAWVPAGFEMAVADVRRGLRDGSLRTLVYSDGLATFSVFVEPAPQASPVHSMRRGATVAVMRGLDTAGTSALQVTVVGEVPMATAMRVADSIRAVPRR